LHRSIIWVQQASTSESWTRRAEYHITASQSILTSFQTTLRQTKPLNTDILRRLRAIKRFLTTTNNNSYFSHWLTDCAKITHHYHCGRNLSISKMMNLARAAVATFWNSQDSEAKTMGNLKYSLPIRSRRLNFRLQYRL
jgi:hypothetical protein